MVTRAVHDRTIRRAAWSDCRASCVPEASGDPYAEQSWSATARSSANQRQLPAAGAPLVERWISEGGVLAVAGVEPGLVGQSPEQLCLHIGQKRGEALGVALGVANPAREP